MKQNPAKQNPDKIQRNIQKHNEKERLTNMYMIQMTYGILGVILLRYLQAGYSYIHRSPWNTVIPVGMLILIVLFAAGAGTLALLFSLGKVENVSRAKNYTIFLCALTLVAMWIRFYNQLYGAVYKIIPAVSRVNSQFGQFYLLMCGIGLYLVIEFVVYTVRISRVK